MYILNIHHFEQNGQISLSTCNSDDEEKYLTDIVVSQKDDNNDEDHIISFGIDKKNDLGKYTFCHEYLSI